MVLGDPGTGPLVAAAAKGPGDQATRPCSLRPAARQWPLRLDMRPETASFEEALPGSAGPHAVAQVRGEPRRREDCSQGESSRAYGRPSQRPWRSHAPLVNLTARKRPLLPPSRLLSPLSLVAGFRPMTRRPGILSSHGPWQHPRNQTLRPVRG